MWIESHQELARHPKTKRLSRALNISVPATIGHLHLLWWWAMDYAQYGELTQHSNEDIADAALWGQNPADFIFALISAGFVDKTENGLFIHDWYDYAGKLLERREKDRERKRKSKSFPVEIHRKSDGIREESMRTVPNQPYPTDHTVPNQTEQNNTDDIGADAPTLKERHKYGQYGWVKLTDDEHLRLVNDYGQAITDQYITIVDESAQQTGNKNKWKDWNLTVRKAIKNKWGNQNNYSGKKQTESSNPFLDMVLSGELDE